MRNLMKWPMAIIALGALAVQATADPQNDKATLPGNQGKTQVLCDRHSLQDAVDRAAEGGEITVTGICNEQVVIRKDRVRIVGSPGATVQAPPGGIAFTVLSDGVVISDLYITGGSVAIDIAKGASADITGNAIHDYTETGIRIRANSNAEIVGNTIDGPAGSFTAIGLLAGASAQLDNNTIVSNGLFGINVAAASSALLANNNLSTPAASSLGIVINRTAQLAFAPGSPNVIQATGLALFCSQTSSILAGANQDLTGGVILHPNCEVVTLPGVTLP